jgi:hypothetical protein
VSEKEIRLQLLGHSFVFSKFLAIIRRESMQAIRNWMEQLNPSLANLVGSASIHFAQQGEARLTFCQGDNGLAMPLASEGVHFPITDPQTFLDNSWSLFNAHSVGQLATTVVAAIAFAAFLLAAEMTIQIASRLFVYQDVLVNPLMTDLDGLMSAQPPRDLLWAPIQTQLRFDQLPCFRQDANSAVIATIKRLVMGLFGPVGSCADRNCGSAPGL